MPTKSTSYLNADESDESRKAWKREVGYHRHSLSETAMYRFQQLIGGWLKARRFGTQPVEALVGIAVLNRPSVLGMPIRE